MDETLDRVGRAGIDQIPQGIGILLPRSRVIGAVEHIIYAPQRVGDLSGIGEIRPNHLDWEPSDPRRASGIAEDAAHFRTTFVQEPFDKPPANEALRAGHEDPASARDYWQSQVLCDGQIGRSLVP